MDDMLHDASKASFTYMNALAVISVLVHPYVFSRHHVSYMRGTSSRLQVAGRLQTVAGGPCVV